MNNTEVVHLHDDTSSVVINLQDAGLPVVTHWGRTLGDVDQTALRGLVDVVTGTIPNSSPDHVVALALLPDAGAGHSGRPGLRGHRGGEHFAPALAVTSHSVENSTFRYTAEDSAAELTVTGVLELAASLGMPTREETLYEEDLASADEAFLTSSTKEIVPIVAVDSLTIDGGVPGPVTKRLLEAFRARTARPELVAG